MENLKKLFKNTSYVILRLNFEAFTIYVRLLCAAIIVIFIFGEFATKDWFYVCGPK